LDMQELRFRIVMIFRDCLMGKATKESWHALSQ